MQNNVLWSNENNFLKTWKSAPEFLISKKILDFVKKYLFFCIFRRKSVIFYNFSNTTRFWYKIFLPPFSRKNPKALKNIIKMRYIFCCLLDQKSQNFSIFQKLLDFDRKYFYRHFRVKIAFKKNDFRIIQNWTSLRNF